LFETALQRLHKALEKEKREEEKTAQAAKKHSPH
jgi:hypothetical protein